MANRTDPLARMAHGTNPQNLIEKIVRERIYASVYWKQHCFGLSAEGVVGKALELDSVGGMYGGAQRPTAFMCLVLKLLQLMPEPEIALELIRTEDHKYVRLLGAFYWRLVGRGAEVYTRLEPLYNDWRKVRVRQGDGSYALSHVDSVVDDMLRRDHLFNVALPHVPARRLLERAGALEPRRSALDDEVDRIEAEEAEAKAKEAEAKAAEKVDEKPQQEDEWRQRQREREREREDERGGGGERRRERWQLRPEERREVARRRRSRSRSRSRSPRRRYDEGRHEEGEVEEGEAGPMRRRGGGEEERRRGGGGGSEYHRRHDYDRHDHHRRQRHEDERHRQQQQQRREPERAGGGGGGGGGGGPPTGAAAAAPPAGVDAEIAAANELRAKLGLKPLRP